MNLTDWTALDGRWSCRIMVLLARFSPPASLEPAPVDMVKRAWPKQPRHAGYP